MSDDLDRHDDHLREILRRAVPEGPEPVGRADSVVRRGRRDNRRRGATGVFAVGVVALVVFLSPNILETRGSTTDQASGSALPAVCPKDPYPASGVPPWSALDLVAAEVCVYQDFGEITGPYPLPPALLEAVNRDYAERVVHHRDMNMGLGPVPHVVVYGRTASGNVVSMNRDYGAFNRGPVSWMPSAPIERRIQDLIYP